MSAGYKASDSQNNTLPIDLSKDDGLQNRLPNRCNLWPKEVIYFSNFVTRRRRPIFCKMSLFLRKYVKLNFSFIQVRITLV